MRWVAFGMAVALAGCSSEELRKCDAAIQATLKAPATYKRVSAEKVEGSDYQFRISYDAANSYNTPIRSAGTCYAVGDKGAWFEDRPRG